MNKVDRIIKTIYRENVDYMPSQITFADKSRDDEIAIGLGLRDKTELPEYLENHIEFLYTKHDLPLFYRNDLELMRELHSEGVVGLDEENRIVYDVWGVGIEISDQGFFPKYAPLKGDKEANNKARKFLPRNFNIDLLDMGLEQSVREYIVPNHLSYNNLIDLTEHAKTWTEDLLPIYSGYFGIFERSHGILGWEQIMLYFALYPDLVEEMMDKVVGYKISLAEEYVKMGVKICHHGDDLGMQSGTLFSKDMIQQMYLPKMKKLFKVYKDAGMKIIYHSCGNITSIIPDLIDAGVDVLEPVQPCMNLKFLKENYGNDLIFMGGIDTQHVLPHGTPEEVRKHAREVIRTLGKNGGYIIAPAQEIMNDVPLENIIALVQTMKEERANF